MTWGKTRDDLLTRPPQQASNSDRKLFNVFIYGVLLVDYLQINDQTFGAKQGLQSFCSIRSLTAQTKLASSKPTL